MKKEILSILFILAGMAVLTPVMAKDQELNRENDIRHLQTVLAETPTVTRLIDETLEMSITECQTVAVAEPTVEPTTEEIRKLDFGEFEITFYCCCEKCCGKNIDHPAYGITASGEKAVEGITVAADPMVFPFGCQLEIEGYGTYIVQDTGSSIKGNKLDIFMGSHEQCLEMGVKKANVTLVVNASEIDLD